MTEDVCGPSCVCILCKTVKLLDYAQGLENDYDKGLELILFAAGALTATVEGYSLARLIGRVSQAYRMTAADLEKMAEDTANPPATSPPMRVN